MKNAFGLILLCLLIASNVSARTLSLKEAVREFIKRSPALEAARADEKKAGYEVKEAFSQMLPNIKLKGVIEGQEQPDEFGGTFFNGRSYSTLLEASQPIFMGGKVFNGLSLKRVQKEMASYQYFLTKQEQTTNVVKKSLEVASLKTQISILKLSEKTQKEFMNLTRKRRKRGTALRFEYEQAQADYLSYQPRIQAIEEQYHATQQELSSLLGFESETIEISWPARPKVDLGPVRPWIKQAYQQRPDYIVKDYEVKVAQKKKWIDQADHLPQLSLAGTYGYKTREKSNIGDDTALMHTVQLTLEVPLFSGLSSVYKKRASEQVIYAAEKNKKQIEINIEAEVKRAHVSVLSAKKRLEQATAWSEKAQAALGSGIQSYRVGRVSNFQVVQLQQGNERAALSRTESLQAFHVAVLNWYVAIGRDLEEAYR